MVVIQPVRNMDVSVTLDIVETTPPLDLDAFDHVAEASLDLPSGRLEIHECTGGSVDILTVASGTYRVRACFSGLDTLSEDGLDGRIDMIWRYGRHPRRRSKYSNSTISSRKLTPWAAARGRAGRRG